MWIQLPAAFVSSDKSSYVQSLSSSDFNQFSGEVCVCVGDTDQDLPYVAEKCACVFLGRLCTHTTSVRMSEQRSDGNCLIENAHSKET